jgi:site-specific DNA recombinase
MRGRKTTGPVTVKATVGYCRVSTEDQAKTGSSLDAQRERIAAHCVATGRKLDEVYVDDGESAKDLKRPEVQKLLDRVDAGEIGAVVVLKLDRLTRSVRDLADLLERFDKRGVALVSITETLDTSTATGRMVINLIAAVGQWEREAIGERTAIVLAHKRTTGSVYGRTPFGWRREGDKLIKDALQQAELTVMRTMHKDGHSYSQIAAFMNGKGKTPARGKLWYPSSVRAVLTSKMTTETGMVAVVSGVGR